MTKLLMAQPTGANSETEDGEGEEKKMLTARTGRTWSIILLLYTVYTKW